MTLRSFLSAVGLLGLAALPTRAQGPAILGRWDLTMSGPKGSFPSWFEVVRSGDTLAGRFQGEFGHATPLAGIRLEGDRFEFLWPVEGNPAARPSRIEGSVAGSGLRGELVGSRGDRFSFTGTRAPVLARRAPHQWAPAIDLLAGGLAAWRPRDPGVKSGWKLVDGVLTTAPPSVDLVTRQTFTDFRLHLEAKVPAGGNSGIYLRGRHEIQVQDDFGKAPGSRLMGGVYGQVTPTALPARPAGEWQTFDITFVGRRVTVQLNGETIIDRAEIPGITGGALDSDEGAPGPLMLQGDHTGVSYRNIRIEPALDHPAEGVLAAVEAAELDRFKAQMTGDTTALRNLLGDELRYVHSNALIESKAHFIETVASGRIRYDDIAVVDMTHRLYGPMAVGSGKVRVAVTMGGQALAVDLLFTTVLANRDGRWQLVAWQSTRAQ
ncbi:MAG: family 16 glycoside hydrolase [Gemmatimonadales bacterium]